uniref:RxLR effector protein n=1 Tax=Phytophthora sojae TaxID=67593 RepID=G1FTD6_PHYSO|nr:Avh457 [Phytophthora sojae]
MRTYLVLLMAVGAFLSSSSALPTTTDSSPNKLQKNEAVGAVAPHANRNDQRFLRSYEEKVDADSEDRDLAGFIKAVKAMSSRSTWDEYVYAKKLAQIKKYYGKKMSYEKLYKEKRVDFSDAFHALKIPDEPKGSEIRKWYDGYYEFWVAMKEKNIKGG